MNTTDIHISSTGTHTPAPTAKSAVSGALKAFVALVIFALLSSIATPAFADDGTVANDGVGQKQQPIIDGEPVLGTDFPFVGALYKIDDDGNHSFFCTSTLISPQWVLTAAHCVTNSAGQTNVGQDRIQVRFGVTRAGETGDELDSVRVESIIVHERFDPEDSRGLVYPDGAPNGFLDRDLALLRLERPSTVKPVYIAAPADYSSAEAGDPVTLVGYGRPCGVEGRESCNLDGVLRMGEASILSENAAKKALNEFCFVGICQKSTSYVHEYMIAIEGANSCQGDSGGPLLVQRFDGSYRQIGVTSWGASSDTRFLGFGSQNSCVASKPSVYARTVNSELSDWIAKVAVEPTEIEATILSAKITLDESNPQFDETLVGQPGLEVELTSVSTNHHNNEQQTFLVPAGYGHDDWFDLNRTLQILVWGSDDFAIFARVDVPFTTQGETPNYCPPGAICPPGNTKPIAPRQLRLTASDSFSLDDDGKKVIITTDVSFGTLELEVQIGEAPLGYDEAVKGPVGGIGIGIGGANTAG